MKFMKRRLSLSLLGSFQVECDHELVTQFEYDKVRALLAYLVVEGDLPHRRDALIGLLWPDQSDRAARHSLSQALLTLRQALGDQEAAVPFFLVDRTSIRFNPAAERWLDVAEYETLLAACARHDHARAETCAICMEWRRQAAALYRGDFLKGLAVGDSAAFEEWATWKRERLHRLALDALAELTRYHEWRGELDQAQTYARRQVELEPWREEAHRQLIGLLARSGQRSAALAQYATCRRLLEEEFGVEPSDETNQLYERIRAPGAARHRNLPAQPNPFVGREEEVAEIASLLAHPDCRALTIVGPGGVGKTRLAVQVGERVADAFLNGVAFVPLAGLRSAALLATTLAQALDFAFYGAADPTAQLLDYLRQKELLLVLDSFEHLQAAAGLLAEVLQSAPQVKILITSRARLNLSWEWAFELGGLAVPEARRAGGLESYSAVQLFVQRARRVHRHFSMAPADQPAIVRVCELVEGLPLALELAASWVRVSACEEIAAEIGRGLDFLSTSSPDVPERHQSMRAVFEHSWQLLSPEQQTVFQNLSVFRGGFSRAAAKQVTGASLPILAELVDASLVRHQASGRYDKHELLRQYAEEKRNRWPEEKDKLLDQHSRYYCAFLQERETRLHGGDQQQALAEIDQEIENVRAAWQRLAARANVRDLARCLEGMFLFYDLRSWVKEGQAVFGLAVEQLAATERAPERDLVLARLMARQARFSSQLSDYDTARRLLEQGIEVFRHFGAQADIAFALNQLGEIAWQTGSYEAAKASIQESLTVYAALKHRKGMATALSNLGLVIHNQGKYRDAQNAYTDSLTIFREIGDRWGEANALHRLGSVAYELGSYQEAEQRYRESLELKRELGDPWGVANSLNNLGIVFYDLGEYAAAEQCYRESLAIRRERGNRWGIAAVLNNLGLIASAQKAFAEAQGCYQESLAICRAIGDQRGIAIALNNVGEIAFTLGAYDEAKQHYQESLAIFKEIGQTRGTTFALGYLGDVSFALGEYEAAKAYYGQVLQLALDTQAAPRALDALAGLSALLAREGQAERAVELLALVLGHAASEKPTREKAQQQMAAIAPRLSATAVASAQERGKARELVAAVQALLAEIGSKQLPH
jgi:predicted ATPase/DNA-binding SARP family transcriptional activator/TolA-binding protein